MDIAPQETGRGLSAAFFGLVTGACLTQAGFWWLVRPAFDSGRGTTQVNSVGGQLEPLGLGLASPDCALAYLSRAWRLPHLPSGSQSIAPEGSE